MFEQVPRLEVLRIMCAQGEGSPHHVACDDGAEHLRRWSFTREVIGVDRVEHLADRDEAVHPVTWARMLFTRFAPLP